MNITKGLRKMTDWQWLLPMLAVLVFMSACPNSPTNPKDENPYKQEPIDWPSLADSPWPMYRHDPQNTGRSPYPGAISGTIVDKITSSNSQTGVVAGLDSSLYFYDEMAGIHYLRTTDLLGNIKWSKQLGIGMDYPSAVPVVLYDGSIVSIGKEDGEFIRLTASGDTLWQCFVPTEKALWAANPGLTVGLDTTIYYITSDQCLVAISHSGELKWTLTDDRFSVVNTNMPAFSPDGKTLYVNGDNGVTVCAIDLTSRSVIWTFGEIPLTNSIVVDNQGNIFINNGKPYPYTGNDYSFFSLNSEGILRWKYPISHLRDTYEKSPSIDWDGNVYFVANDTLYSFTNDGDLRWKIPDKYISCPLVIDVDNNTYGFDCEEDLTGYCIDISGDLVWDMKNSSEFTRLGGSPIIVNNSILVPGWRSEWIYVIQ